MNTLLLLAVLLGCLIIGFRLTGGNLISPIVIFFVPFVFAVLDGFLYYSAWNYNLNIKTVVTVSLGSIFFTLACIYVHQTYGRKICREQGRNSESIKQNLPSFSSGFYLFLSSVLVIMVVNVFSAEKRVVGQYQSVSSISEVLTGYNNLSKFSESDTTLSFLDSLLQQMILGVSLFIAYLYANEVTKKGKFASRTSFICFLTAFLAAFLTGNRTWPLAVLFSFVITYLLNLQILNRIRSLATIKVKYVISAVFIFCVLLILFYFTTFALGRENTMSPLYYISVYLGAPLKNLDIAISQGITRSTVPGEYSFNFLFISLNKKFGVNSSLISSLPYQSVNNNPIGNVYTIYFALLTDFGLIGCLFFMILLGIAVQLIQEKSMLSMTHRSLSFLAIIYGYVMFQLMVSFFAHFITQNIVSLGFLKSICAIFILYVIASCVQMKSTQEPITGREDQPFVKEQY